MLITLIGIIVIVREIGPSQYGIYSAAGAYVLVIATAAQMGTEIYLIRVDKEPDRHLYNQAFTFLFCVSMTITALSIGATFLLAPLLRPVGVALPLRILLLSIPINVLWAPAQACIERRFGYREMGILEIVGDIALYGTAIPLALTGAGAWALVAGYIVWQTWLLIGSLIMSGLRPRWEWSGKTMKTLSHHGLTFSSSTWVAQLGGLVSPIVVGTFVGAAGVGFVAFASRLVSVIGFAQRGAYRLGMVAMSKVPSEDKARLRYGIEEGSLLQLMVLAVPFAAFGVVARWVIPLVFGHEWLGAIPLYSLLAVSTMLSGPGLIQTTLLFSRGKNMTVTVASLIQVAVLAVASVVLVHWFGIIGFGIASLLDLVGLLYIDRMVRRITDFSMRMISVFAVALTPMVLFPILPLRIAPVVFLPAIALAFAPSVRHEAVRLSRLVITNIRGAHA